LIDKLQLGKDYTCKVVVMLMLPVTVVLEWMTVCVR